MQFLSVFNDITKTADFRGKIADVSRTRMLHDLYIF